MSSEGFYLFIIFIYPDKFETFYYYGTEIQSLCTIQKVA